MIMNFDEMRSFNVQADEPMLEVAAIGFGPVTGVVTNEAGWYGLFLRATPPEHSNVEITLPNLAVDIPALATLIAAIDEAVEMTGQTVILRAAVDQERIRLREIDAAIRARGDQLGARCVHCGCEATWGPLGQLLGKHLTGCPHPDAERQGRG